MGNRVREIPACGAPHGESGTGYVPSGQAAAELRIVSGLRSILCGINYPSFHTGVPVRDSEPCTPARTGAPLRCRLVLRRCALVVLPRGPVPLAALRGRVLPGSSTWRRPFLRRSLGQ